MDRRRHQYDDRERARERDSYRTDDSRRDNDRMKSSRDRDDEDYYRGRRSNDRPRNRSKSPVAVDSRRPYRSQNEPRRDYRDLDRPEEPKKEKLVEKKTAAVSEETEPVFEYHYPIPTLFTNHFRNNDDEEAQLAAFLGGVTEFGSTKGKKVAGNEHASAVDCPKKRREYRQYLFVKGSYDIPLTKDQLEEKEREQKQQQQKYE